MRFILYTFFLCCSTFVFAQQHYTCDGIRYRTTVFSDVSATTAIQFGSNTTIAGNSQDLFMDIYEPMGDTTSRRPAIIVAFGGSFIGGSRDQVADICRSYAQKGYVAVAIDYRLYDLPLFPIPTADEMTDVVVKSIGDMKAAIRFLREDAANGNTYGIESDLIFVGGVSAGAITASHTAVLDSTDNITPSLRQVIANNGGFRGNSSDNFAYGDEVAGFVNMSGALSDAKFIDANDPPFYSIHEEFDPTVPYGNGMANVFGFDIIYVEGSQTMNQVADSVGLTNFLNTIEGSTQHVGYFAGTPEEAEAVVLESAGFLHDIFCDGISTSTSSPALANIQVYPNPTTGQLFLNVPVELSVNVQLYNGLGQQLGQWVNPREINLSALSQGMYYLELTDSQGGNRQIEKIFLR